MFVVDPFYEIQDELDQASLVIRLEACGRICYKSEEKINRDSALPFVKKIAENYKIPYFTITPSFSICPVHGYISGEHEECPHESNDTITSEQCYQTNRSGPAGA